MVLGKVFIGLFLICQFCYGQNAQEIFNQKKTLIKYLSQQVAALQVYIGYARQGYSIAKDGLNMIGDIKKGDFNLHNNYFNSLKQIKPAVATYSRIADIISFNVQIMKGYKAAYKRLKESGQFTAKEIAYIYSVFTKIIDEAGKLVEDLIALITPDDYESDGYQMKMMKE
jgi:hypothetical protein